MRYQKTISMGGDLDNIVFAAHELKSPLALVRQLALSLGDENITIEEKNLVAHKIKITAEKAIRLTSDLTKSNSLDNALFNLEPVNPIEICKDVLMELKPIMKIYHKKINLRHTKSHPLLMIANRDLLRRIIINFADNAVYYGEDSNIEMVIKNLRKTQKIRLSLRDKGPSIEKKQFNSFINNNTKVKRISSRPESSGLGIYLASQFANAMKGKIGIIRHKDGVTFFVDLDASRQMSLL